MKLKEVKSPNSLLFLRECTRLHQLIYASLRSPVSIQRHNVCDRLNIISKRTFEQTFRARKLPNDPSPRPRQQPFKPGKDSSSSWCQLPAWTIPFISDGFGSLSESTNFHSGSIAQSKRVRVGDPQSYPHSLWTVRRWTSKVLHL